MTPLESSSIASSYPPHSLPCPSYTSSQDSSYRSRLQSALTWSLLASDTKVPFSALLNRPRFTIVCLCELLSYSLVDPPTTRQQVDECVRAVVDPVEMLCLGVFLEQVQGDVKPYIENQGFGRALIEKANDRDVM